MRSAQSERLSTDVPSTKPQRTLLLAEAANPDWVSVPLVGWSLVNAISRTRPFHLVTHVRNRGAILSAGMKEGRDFSAIDSEAVAGPLWRLGSFFGGKRGAGWTTTTAFAALAYYYFESLVWKRFGTAIRRHDFDVIHRITPLSPTIPSTLAQRCHDAGVPFIAGPLNGGVPWPKGFDCARRQEREWLSYVRPAYKLMPAYKSTLNSAAALIVGSKDTLHQIPDRLHSKCIYLPENAVDPGKFSMTAVSRAPHPPLRACFVGRLVPYKGPDMLLEALAPLLRDGRFFLDVVGDGPLMGGLRTFVQREGLEHCVQFHGWLDHRDVQKIMAGANLLTFPSIREFGGAVVLEAMALGVVPVVVDYGGPGELVTSECGIKVALGSREAIIERFRSALEQISSRPEELSTLAAKARERVRSHFTWDAKASQINAVYDWVLGRCGQKPAFFS